MMGTIALVIANATVDETYAVDTIPGAGESLIGHFRLRDVGGKGANVATVLARCGVATTLMAGVGNDDRGEFVRQALSQEPLQLALVSSPHHPTDISVIYTDARGENSIVTTVAATRCVDHSHASGFIRELKMQGLLVLTGNLDQETTDALIGEARRAGMAVVLNPSPCHESLKTSLPEVDILFLNQGEAETLTGLRNEAAVRSLLDHGVMQVVLTRGDKGALLGTHGTGSGRTSRETSGATSGEIGVEASGEASVEASGESHDSVIRTVAAVSAEVVDTTGAGDTYMGVALASSMLRGTVIDALALQHAARAASITVSRFGTRSAFPDAATLAGILAGQVV